MSVLYSVYIYGIYYKVILLLNIRLYLFQQQLDYWIWKTIIWFLNIYIVSLLSNIGVTKIIIINLLFNVIIISYFYFSINYIYDAYYKIVTWQTIKHKLLIIGNLLEYSYFIYKLFNLKINILINAVFDIMHHVESNKTVVIIYVQSIFILFFI